jgi:hypothetical protein
MVKALWDGEFMQQLPSLAKTALKKRASGGITN